MSAAVSVDIQVASAAGKIPGEADMRSWVQDVLNELAADGDYELSIRVVDEKEGYELNKQFRDGSGATNVLSFAADATDSITLPSGLQRHLGDVVICGPLVEREAAEQQKVVASHWAHLIVHGTLHLLGYDHENDTDAAEMEAIETRILGRRGVANPYVA